MEYIQEIIVAVRTIRAELGIAPAKKLSCLLRPENDEQAACLARNRHMIESLARLEPLVVDRKTEIPKASASAVVQGCEVVVLLAGAVDLTAELARLDKEITKIYKESTVIQNKLANSSFIERAPAEVVERERSRGRELAGAAAKLEELRARFARAAQE